MASEISITEYSMGTADTERDIEGTNTDANENSKGKPVTVKTPAKDVVDKHHAHTRQHRDSLTMDRDDSREALEEQKLPSEELTNPTLPKTTIIVGNKYALYRILSSPAQKKKKGHRR
jgi:hypothetical protein